MRKIDTTSTGGHAISVVGISELVKDKEAISLDKIDKKNASFVGAMVELNEK